MKIIGITGQIGAGKSTVIEYVKKLGHKCIIEDDVAKKIRNSKEVSEAIKEHFGKEMTTNDLRQAIKNDKESVLFLNNLIHPMVYDYVKKQIEASKNNGDKAIFIESALPREARFNELCDEVWYIKSNFDKRKMRVLETRNITPLDFDNLDNLQGVENINNLEVINNNGTIDDLMALIDRQLNKL